MTVLPPTTPDPVEQAVSKHLATALDGQRGRAAASFHKAVTAGQDGPASFSLSAEHDRLRSLRTLKIWATAASALAACLAVLVTLQMMSHPLHDVKTSPATVAQGGAQPGAADSNVANVNVPLMDQVELSREVDGGTAMLQNDDDAPPTPVRVVRQQTLRQSQWFDPNENATYRVTQPGETVNYVKIQPY